MNITDAQYTATGSITALVDGVEMFIPADAGNRHYREMVEQGIAIAPYVKPAATAEEVRAQRDRLLAESDWIVTKAIEQNAQDGLGVQIPVVWLDYRQALRDIPQQPAFPDNVTWPTAP